MQLLTVSEILNEIHCIMVDLACGYISKDGFIYHKIGREYGKEKVQDLKTHIRALMQEFTAEHVGKTEEDKHKFLITLHNIYFLLDTSYKKRNTSKYKLSPFVIADIRDELLEYMLFLQNLHIDETKNMPYTDYGYTIRECLINQLERFKTKTAQNYINEMRNMVILSDEIINARTASYDMLRTWSSEDEKICNMLKDIIEIAAPNDSFQCYGKDLILLTLCQITLERFHLMRIQINLHLPL